MSGPVAVFGIPMVDRRNVTRQRLNRLACGPTGEEDGRHSGGRRFSIGDRVAARRPDRR